MVQRWPAYRPASWQTASASASDWRWLRMGRPRYSKPRDSGWQRFEGYRRRQQFAYLSPCALSRLDDKHLRHAICRQEKAHMDSTAIQDRLLYAVPDVSRNHQSGAYMPKTHGNLQVRSAI